jgi:23S rRNA (uracil1939-C5)-methyltransferase
MSRYKRAPRKENTNHVVEVGIEKILPGGLGLAHLDNKTILVELAVAGDQLRVKINRVQGKVAFASIVEIIKPSPLRIEPPCPYFGRCGGCDMQQMNYETQLNVKAEIVRDCLQRIARLKLQDPIPIVASPKAWNYRSRAKWQYDSRNNKLGYFELGSHRVCDVAECPVLTNELQETFAHLRKRIHDGESLPESEIQGVVGGHVVSLVPQLDQFETQEVISSIGEDLYRFDATCFFQINQSLLESLIKEAIGDVRGEMAIDLYCGVGLFSLPLARRFTRLLAVEVNDMAVGYARRNLAEANLINAKVEIVKVGDWLVKQAGQLNQIDFILLDPPRSGAESETIQGLMLIKPKHISYVSCDPATLARDLRILLEGGYKLESIKAFDMFPQTHHVETIVHLKL